MSFKRIYIIQLMIACKKSSKWWQVGMHHRPLGWQSGVLPHDNCSPCKVNKSDCCYFLQVKVINDTKYEMVISSVAYIS